MRENLKFKAWVGKNEEVYTEVNDGVFIPPTTQKKTLDFSRVLVSGNSRVLSEPKKHCKARHVRLIVKEFTQT